MSSTSKKNQICCWLGDEAYQKVCKLVRPRGDDSAKKEDYEFGSFSEYMNSLIVADLARREGEADRTKQTRLLIDYLGGVMDSEEGSAKDKEFAKSLSKILSGYQEMLVKENKAAYQHISKRLDKQE